jgi:hypothetical protein
MNQLRKFGRVGLLTAMVFILNACILLKGAHPRHALTGPVNHTSLPHHQQRGPSRSRFGAAHYTAASDHASSSVAPRSKPVFELTGGFFALPSLNLFHFAPEFVPAPMAQENVLARGSAARAPGAPRGPPSIS